MTQPLARWSAIVAIVLMGAALLVTAWTSYTSVVDASATLVRGQADFLEQALRGELGPSTPTSADLAEFLADQSPAGLRYVATFDPAGVIQAEAGAALGGGPSRRSFGQTVTAIGDRIRLELRLRDRRGWRMPGRPAGVILEFEPVQARTLRDAAARTFYLGVAAAGMLLVVAAALVRSILRAAARERQLAHERRLASLGEMSAVLAHEIRNPLASLKGNAQLLAEKLAPGDKARQKADRVVEEAIRLETLTNNLLAFVRTGELARADASPGVLLREAAAAVDPDIAVDDVAAPASWSLDAERMRQVLVNLLANAVQAGGPVHARVAGAAGRLVFEVEDHGPGVPAADAERIFEPFYTKRAQGTGLGLAVAKRVVELHAGTITVGDAPGGGARFRVTIPEA
jgi:two-component system, NtrC family, sensor histidine kinase HydH